MASTTQIVAGPNQTLYIKNLNDKVKTKELRESLYALFSQHGRVIDIVASKTPRMRGQAFVVFDSITSSTSAMRVLQSFPFYEKEMIISYAKSISNKVRLMHGEYRAKSIDTNAAQNNFPVVRADNAEEEDEDDESDAHHKRGMDVDDQDDAQNATKRIKDSESAPPEPNNILFISKIPASTTEAALHTLFSGYAGYRDLRVVPGRPDIAFVEYETVEDGERVVTDMNGGLVMGPGIKISVEFAKKD